MTLVIRHSGPLPGTSQKAVTGRGSAGTPAAGFFQVLRRELAARGANPIPAGRVATSFASPTEAGERPAAPNQVLSPGVAGSSWLVSTAERAMLLTGLASVPGALPLSGPERSVDRAASAAPWQWEEKGPYLWPMLGGTPQARTVSLAGDRFAGAIEARRPTGSNAQAEAPTAGSRGRDPFTSSRFSSSSEVQGHQSRSVGAAMSDEQGWESLVRNLDPVSHLAVRTTAGHTTAEPVPLGPAEETRAASLGGAPASGTLPDCASSGNGREARPMTGHAASARREHEAGNAQRAVNGAGPAVADWSQGRTAQPVHTMAEVKANAEVRALPGKGPSANISRQATGEGPGERAPELSLRTSQIASQPMADPPLRGHGHPLLPKDQAVRTVKGAPLAVGSFRLPAPTVPGAVGRGQPQREPSTEVRTAVGSWRHESVAVAGAPTDVAARVKPRSEREPGIPMAVSEPVTYDAQPKKGAPGLDVLVGEARADDPRQALAATTRAVPTAQSAPAHEVNPKGNEVPRQPHGTPRLSPQLPLTPRAGRDFRENAGPMDWRPMPQGELRVRPTRATKESGAPAAGRTVGGGPTPLREEDLPASSAATERSYGPEGWRSRGSQPSEGNSLRKGTAQSGRKSKTTEFTSVNVWQGDVARGEQGKGLPSNVPLHEAKTSGRASSHLGHASLRESNMPSGQARDPGRVTASSNYRSLRAPEEPVQEKKDSRRAYRPVPAPAAEPFPVQKRNRGEIVARESEQGAQAASVGRVVRERWQRPKGASWDGQGQRAEPLPRTLAMAASADKGQDTRCQDVVPSAGSPSLGEPRRELSEVAAPGGAVEDEGTQRDASSIATAKRVPPVQQNARQSWLSVPGERGAVASPAHEGAMPAPARVSKSAAYRKVQEEVRAPVDVDAGGDANAARKMSEPYDTAPDSQRKSVPNHSTVVEANQRVRRDGAEMGSMVAPVAQEEAVRPPAGVVAVPVPPRVEAPGERVQALLSSSPAARPVLGRRTERRVTEPPSQFGANAQVGAPDARLGQESAIRTREVVQGLAKESASPSTARQTRHDPANGETQQSGRSAIHPVGSVASRTIVKGKRRRDLAVLPAQVVEEARVNRLGVASSGQEPSPTQKTPAALKPQPDATQERSAHLREGRAEARGAETGEKAARSARRQESAAAHMARQRLLREDESVVSPLPPALAAEQAVGGASSGPRDPGGQPTAQTTGGQAPLRQDHLARAIGEKASRSGRIEPTLQEAWPAMRRAPRAQRPPVAEPAPAVVRSAQARVDKAQPPEHRGRNQELAAATPADQAAPRNEGTDYRAKERLSSPLSGGDNGGPSAHVRGPGLMRSQQDFGIPNRPDAHVAPAAKQPDVQLQPLPRLDAEIESRASRVHAQSTDHHRLTVGSVKDTTSKYGGSDEPKVRPVEAGSPDRTVADSSRQVSTPALAQPAGAKTSNALPSVDSRKEGSQARWSEQVEAIARELAQSLRLMVRAEETRLRVTIEQPELGRIAVDLAKHEQTLSAQFRVESPQTQALLESSFNDLRTMLGEQGVQLGELSVAVEQRGDGGQRWPRPEESAPRESDAAPPAPATPREAEREPHRPRLFGYNTIEITA